MSRMIVFALFALLGACAAGEYRIPYSNGVEIAVNRDFITHTGPVTTSYDVEAKVPPAAIVAAAPGWVRHIEDGFAADDANNPDEKNNYVWIEHPYPYCPVDPDKADWPGKPPHYNQTCIRCEDPRGYCNEWTFYYHMAQGTVTGKGLLGAGLSEGDWVEAGQPIGVESEVGFTPGGVHLHWHVAVIDPAWEPNTSGNGGDYEHEHVDGTPRPELIPIVCTANGDRVLLRFFDYVAAPCP